VHYLDRVSTCADRVLTPEEWGRVWDNAPEYDEWLSNSGGWESVCYFRDMVLQRAGINTDEDEAEDEDRCATCAVPEHDTCSMQPGCSCCDDTINNTGGS
jgi:hypothetical protein